jgi:hypothetical protein
MLRPIFARRRPMPVEHRRLTLWGWGQELPGFDPEKAQAAISGCMPLGRLGRKSGAGQTRLFSFDEVERVRAEMERRPRR